MGEGLCQFPGCPKPVFDDGSKSKLMNAIACGRLHHLQIMCQRFCAHHPEHEHGLKPFFTLLNPTTCGLDGCGREAYPGHSWCSKTHYLLWFRQFHMQLDSRQVCGLPQCNRHVYVEAGGKVHAFCGWKHTQKYYNDTKLPILVNHPLSPAQSEANGHAQSNITHCCDSSIDYVIKSLKNLTQSKSELPKNVQIDNDFFSKHPWEVLVAERQTCTFITKRTYKSKMGGARQIRHLITKEGYHWKPTGKPTVEDGITKRYLTYQKMTSVTKSNDEPEDMSFSMIEYTTSGSQEYCAIYLSRKRKESKGQKKTKRARNCTGETEENGTRDVGGHVHGVVQRPCDMEDGLGSSNSSPMLHPDGQSQSQSQSRSDMYDCSDANDKKKIHKYLAVDMEQVLNLILASDVMASSPHMGFSDEAEHSLPPWHMIDHCAQEAISSQWSPDIFSHNAWL